MSEFSPETQSELQNFVAENARGERHVLYPAGGRTKFHYGYPPRVPGTTVSLSRLAQVVDYPARDMTVTVEAGFGVGALQELLKGERQRLPIDFPQASRATIGGVVATNVSGPRRFGYGTLRDYVIGISAVDAQGRSFHGGGRVVKNVAGYDLCKLLVGSYGTLAIITQLTLKVRPIAESLQLVWMSFDSLTSIDAVLAQLTTSETRPVCLEVLNQQAARHVARESGTNLETGSPVLCVGFEGSQCETQWQVGQLEQELSSRNVLQRSVLAEDAAQPVWNALTNFQAAAEYPLTFQAGLLPSRTIEFIRRADEAGLAVQAHAGNGIVVAHFPPEKSTVEEAEIILAPLRKLALDQAGSLTIFNCDESWKDRLPVFSRRPESLALMHSMKHALDPQNLINPYRYIDGAMA